MASGQPPRVRPNTADHNRSREQAGVLPAQSQANPSSGDTMPVDTVRSSDIQSDIPPDVPDISQKSGSGWGAVSEIVTKVDEERIRDYKEDIDNILVFAGLYSAVLTGLLAESIGSLKQDPSDMIIGLLIQLNSQTHSYSLSSGFLNSTAPIPHLQPPPFTPSLAAKRVNVLWFASLMLSLTSASFGILVKQWLREYLAGTYVSPQARLRVRHFREPGLRHWKVFGIAAILPLFLQVSLALFFIGLCFFTLDIHRSVGYTTIPLVAAWAVLFVAASFAPVLSAKCPYKTPSLRSVVTLLRESIFRCFLYLQKMGQESSIARSRAWGSPTRTEKQAETSKGEDISVLLEVDRTQLDDRLLQHICSALQEMHSVPEDIVDFVLEVISFRLPTGQPRESILSRLRDKSSRNYLPQMLDLNLLPPQTCTILMNTIARTLQPAVKKVPLSEAIEWSNWMKDCMALLCAKLPCLLTEYANDVLFLCFSGTSSRRMKSTISYLTSEVAGSQSFEFSLHIQERLRPVLLRLDSTSFHGVHINFRTLYCNCPRNPCRSTADALSKHRKEIGSVLVNHFLTLQTDYLAHQLERNTPWDQWHHSILDRLSSQWPNIRSGTWRNGYIALINHMLMHPCHSRVICAILLDHRQYGPPIAEACKFAFASSQYREQILGNIRDSLDSYITASEQPIASIQEPREFRDSLTTFLVDQVVWIRQLIRDPETEGPSHVRKYLVPLWQAIGRKTAKLLQVHSVCNESDSHSASRCVHEIQTLREEWRAWAQNKARGMFFFEQDLIDILENLSAPHLRTKRKSDSLDVAMTDSGMGKQTLNVVSGDLSLSSFSSPSRPASPWPSSPTPLAPPNTDMKGPIGA